jgi:uncharacterized membrane protein YhaH (DUF805 family)
MTWLVLAVALAPLAIIVPALGMTIRRWQVYRRMPHNTPVYEYRYAAKSIVIILVMDVGLAVFNVVSVVMFGGSIIGNGISTLVILWVARWELRQYRQMMARAHAAEDEEIAKLHIPDHLPDDL